MNESDHQFYMKLALDEAKKAALKDEVPVGALVVQCESKKIIGQAYNRREADQSPIAHAEVLALQSASKELASWRLENCALFVTLEPCPMCLGAAQQARIKKIIYATSDPKGGALSLGHRFHEDVRMNHRFNVEKLSGPLELESAELLKNFFKAKRA